MDLSMTAEKIQNCLGLANALNKVAWNIEFVPLEHKDDFNSVLTISEYLEDDLKEIYNMIKSEV